MQRLQKFERRKIGKVACFLSMLFCLVFSPTAAFSQTKKDWVTGLPREYMHIKSWSDNSKKVAVCFIFYVEHFGFGEGPNFRPDMLSRKPDVVDEGFRQYAIEWGVPRVGRIFQEQNVPISIALNAQFPVEHSDSWKQFRSLAPKAPIIAHGMNNTTQMLPLALGIEKQTEYIKSTVDLIEKTTGQRSTGWTSPSVYANADTFSASAAAGITYSLDAMDSDILSRLDTKSGPLILIPYPPTPVDMGQFLQRSKDPRDIAKMWVEYVTQLAQEAEKDPDRDATVVAIGLHPFVFGTPDGGFALRNMLENLKTQKNVWLTDVQQVMDVVQMDVAQKK